MAAIMDRLRAGEILVTDGAMGTMLIEMGHDPDNCLETLNLEKPDLIQSIHKEYLRAGADIIHTHTFGASPLRLARWNLASRLRELNAEAVKIARAAVGSEALIAGSIGPCGEALIPFGEVDRQTIYSGFLEQAQVLIDCGVDLISIETMTNIMEATLAIRAVRQISESIPIAASMSFNLTPKGFYSGRGGTIESAATELHRAGADIIGSNCGHGLLKMIKVAREFMTFAKDPVIMRPSAGLPVMKDGKLFYKEDPDFFAIHVNSLIEIGISIIGSCCGTTPEHTKVISQIVSLQTKK